MSKKVISILLSAAMIVAMLCVGVGAVTASADDTYTYYFLAADNFFKPEAGASNESVGVYWWQPSEVAPWPGIEMTAAPEIGENVFKIEGVSPDTTTVIFNAFVDAGNPADPALAAVAHQTVNINTEGYDEDCPYDASVNTDNFNGWIYVLNRNDITVNEFSGAQTTGGAWFTIDNYKNNEQYYGSYGFADDKKDDTDSEPADTTSKKYHAGDTVTVTVEFGDFNADYPRLGAYNYDITYDASKVAVATKSSGKPDAKNLAIVADPDAAQPTAVANTDVAGTVKIGYMAAEGADPDYSSSTKQGVYTIKFNVIADTDDLGITGKCTSLTGMTQDASTTNALVSVNNPDDPYSDLVVDVTCPHEKEPSSSEPEPTPKPDPKPDSKPTEPSKPAESSKTESTKTSSTASKATNDKASSKSTTSGKTTSTANTATATPVTTAGTFAVVSLIVILMAAAAVVLYTRKKTEE